MKIQYEKEIEVSRFKTFEDALMALYGDPTKPVTKKVASNLVSVLMQGPYSVNTLPEVQTRSIAEVRRQVIAREYEGLSAYTRVFAHVSFSHEWQIPKLYQELRERGYTPAGTSESTVYLKVLRAHGVAIGSIFHLGTHIVNVERYEEQKLLVHDDGRVELVTMYDKTVVRPYWHIVVAKIKEESPTASPVFGRNM